ncbi:hypothetical protein [Falsiroseomonas sp. CW058]|uniref:hypothetical protein n=1 Tax=Falsiroseomonas sp. CW058 TaxID=3388664 RepID=UPI003D31911C
MSRTDGIKSGTTYAAATGMPRQRRQDRPTGAYFAGVAGAAGGFELGRLGFRQAFVPKSREFGPKMPPLRLGRISRSLSSGNFRAAGERAARAASGIKSGVGAKLRHGVRWGLPGFAAGIAGATALGGYMQGRAERSEAARGIRSNTEPRDGAYGTIGRIGGGLVGGLGAAAAIGSRLAGRHWSVKIGGAALSSMAGSVAGDWSGAGVGSAFDRYQARTRRRIQKAHFLSEEPLEKLIGLGGKRRDGDGDGRVGDGTPAESASDARAEHVRERLKRRLRGGAEALRQDAGRAVGVARDRAASIRSEVASEIGRFRGLGLDGKAAMVVERGLQALARIERMTGALTPGMYGDGNTGANLDEALELYSTKAGLDAKRVVRTVSDHRRMRVLVRQKIKAARKLLGLMKSGWDDDTLALAWMVREGLASPSQHLELRRRLA